MNEWRVTVYSRMSQSVWRSSQVAQGPFSGLQGGGLASVMVSELEQIALLESIGNAMSVSVEFLRPTPQGELQTKPEPLRKGRRASVLRNSIIVDEKVNATATVCFIDPMEVGGIDLPRVESDRRSINRPNPAAPSPSQRTVVDGCL